MNDSIQKLILANKVYETPATERVIAALEDPDHQFTREQVAYLISIALRIGGTGTEAATKPTRLEIDEAYEHGYQDGIDAHSSAVLWALKEGLCGDGSVPMKTATERHQKAVAAREARVQADAAARLPRIGDYRGGAVAWESTTNRAAA